KGHTAFYLGFLLHAPFLIAYKLKIISNQRAKEMILRYFFGKMAVGEFSACCDGFVRDIAPSLIRPKAVREIAKLKEAGAEVVIVSASPINWVGKWSESMQLPCIATRLVVEDNRITGNIDGKNC